MGESISIPVWWHSGRGGMIRRSTLEPSHPGSTYSYVKNELGLDPAEFGISDTVPFGMCPNCAEFNE